MKKVKFLDKSVMFKMPLATYETFRARCKADQVTVSRKIRTLILEWLDKKPKSFKDKIVTK